MLVADLPPQCRWSLCWAPRGGLLQTRGRTASTVPIRWPPNHLWAVLAEKMLPVIYHPDNDSYPSRRRQQSHFPSRVIMNAFGLFFACFLFIFGRGPAEFDLASSGSSCVTNRAEPKTDYNYDKKELHAAAAAAARESFVPSI